MIKTATFVTKVAVYLVKRAAEQRLELRFCAEWVLIAVSARKTSAFLTECESSSYQLIYKEKDHPKMGW